MRFEVTTLGTGAALPARGRFPSAQLINIHEHLYLVDCGEGTQERLRQAEVNFNRITAIFISHMHGDHYLGLMGLLSSMHLNGRLNALAIYGPPELREVIDVQLRASRTYLRYPLAIHALAHESGLCVYADGYTEVLTLKLKHRIPTTGFLFREKPQPRRLRKERIGDIPHFARGAVKAGEDLVLPDGTVVPNKDLTLDPPAVRRYAYCSDTAFAPELVEYLRGIDLLYHEATFTEELADRAKETCHSTAKQAAMMASSAGVVKLLLGHFSSRYKDNRVLLAEALSIFPGTILADEGRTFRIDQRTPVENSDAEVT
ncbi:MAG: ribonuclease Z [Flavobacteriales bacterium]|nr:ribonuclease Z [Flavobacteriales bacterium]